MTEVNSEKKPVPIDEIFLKWNKDKMEGMNMLLKEILHVDDDDSEANNESSNLNHEPDAEIIKFYSCPDLMKKLQECQIESTKEIRTLSYKLWEYFLSESFLHEIFTEYNIEIFLTRTLVRDSRYDLERQHAISLLFKYLELCDGDAQNFPISVVRVLVSLGEQLDDRLYNTAIELLCELALINPALVSYAGGLRTIFQALLDGPPELLKSVIRTFLFLLDSPNTRCFIRPQLDLENLISQFTDAYTLKGAYPIEKLQFAAAAIQEILASWTGVYFFCAGNKQAIYAIIEALSLPSEEITNLVLSLLQSLIGSLYEVERFEWAIQFQAITLMIFIDAGLIDALVSIVMNGAVSSVDLTFILLSDILTICSKRLPDSYDQKIQALPTLFASALDFQNESVRQFSRDKLSKIFKAHLDAVAKPCRPQLISFPIPEIIEWHPDSNLINIEEVRFRNLVNESEVNGLKDYTKWNWSAISEIMKGSLLNPKRFDELVRNTKFASRMIIFLKPSSRQFIDSSVDENTPKIVSACSNFVCGLASSTPGYRFLVENKLLNEISEKLARMGDPGNFEIDLNFKKESMNTFLSREYFTILGDLQKLPDGERILEDHNLWSVFYLLVQLRGRDDVTKRIISSGNYSHDGHMRIIFSKLLSSGYKEMRLFTTNFIGHLLAKNTPGLEEWIPQVLVPQLFDPAPAVSVAALKLVKECARFPLILVSLIANSPDIEHLALRDNTILMEFLSLPAGYQYLLHDGYIDLEISYWFKHGVYQYVSTADSYMNTENVFESTVKLDFIGGYPPHFIGKLVKTLKGCEYLGFRKELTHFISILAEDVHEEESPISVIMLKAAVWMVSHIGSSETGYQFLKRMWPELDFVALILRIATKSNILSTRGTCLFALSLFSKSISGFEHLELLDWTTKNGICVPNKIDNLFDVPAWEFDGSWPVKRSKTFKPFTDYKPNNTEKEILKCIGNLTNHIISSANSKKLVLLKQTEPAAFSSVQVYILANRIMSEYSFKLQYRRFVQDLFEKFTWDVASIGILTKVNGLCLGTPFRFSSIKVITESKITEQENPNIESSSVSNFIKSKYPSAEIKRGGFHLK